MRAMGKIISTGLVATTLLAGMATSAPALARDWDRGGRHHGHHRGGGGNDGALIALGAIVGLGALMALSNPAPARPYGAPPRVVYADPYAEDDYYAPRRCQEFQRDEYRRGTIYRSYYTACQAPNGRWYPQ